MTADSFALAESPERRPPLGSGGSRGQRGDKITEGARAAVAQGGNER